MHVAGMSDYDAFLTHDWGTDELGRDICGRVGRVAAALEQRGNLPVCFDATGTERARREWGDVMASIDDSACVIAFASRSYLNLAGTNGSASESYLKREFEYVMRRRGTGRTVVVMMESSGGPDDWQGAVGSQ